MVKLPTLVLGTTLGLAALGLSGTASAGVRVGVDVGLPVVAAPPVVAAAPEFVAYRPAPYYRPHFYAGPHYGRPGWAYPRGPARGWNGGSRFHEGGHEGHEGWHR